MEARNINFSGKWVRIIPYSETRRKQLLEVAVEVEKYLNDSQNTAIDPKKRAEFWKRKSEILVEFLDGNPDLSFYESDDFESGMLAWIEQDFIRQRLYL
jgi:hypothetical protein